MTMRPAGAAISVLICATAAVGMFTAWGAPSDPLPEPKHFDHAGHDARGVPVDKCDGCHAIDAKGQLLMPAAQGHSPCLEAKCHASYFLSVGEKQRKADPVAFAKAAPFCLGCHDTVPWPWKKPTVKVLHAYQNQREYHVEMNHYQHTRTKVKGQARAIDCRSCHVVDEKSFALVTGTPGHTQCATCHNAKDYPDFTMAQCGNCHSKPSRAEFFQGSRPDNDVRSCDSEGAAALKEKFARQGRKGRGALPCFRHEREQHRFLENKQPLECKTCHYMIDNKTRWGKARYQTLSDLHTAPIIVAGTEDQHQACGNTAACHARDVDTVNGGRCALCHAEKWAF